MLKEPGVEIPSPEISWDTSSCPEVCAKTKLTEILTAAYKEAAINGKVTFEHPIDFSTFVGNQGQTQKSLLLPNGETIGAKIGIGLSKPCYNPELISVEYSGEDKGYWLEVRAKNKDEKEVISHVLLSEENGVRKKEAILSCLTPEQRAVNPLRADELAELYIKARKDGLITLEPARDFSVFVGNQGQTQHCLLLPNGETIGATIGIGLHKSISSPELHSITYCPEKKAFWLTIRAVYGEIPCESRILLSEEKGVKGREIVLEIESIGSDLLPEEFKQQIQKAGDLARSLTSTKLKNKTGLGQSVTTLKGECFEQLVGVLLSSIYADQEVIPQYCLRVDGKRGFYGVRADFKVGSKIIEVKWGGATENIKATIAKHQKYLKAGQEYEVITMVENSAITFPCTLFSQLIDSSSLKEKLAAVQERVIDIVESEAEASPAMLAAIQRYLYSLMKDANEQSGAGRIEFIKAGLERVIQVSEQKLRSELSAFTTQHWSSLEAYWEYKGVLRRNLITFAQLAAEEPERYDVGYSILVSKKDGSIEPITFTSKLDRDFRVLVECIEDENGLLVKSGRFDGLKIKGNTNDAGWFEQPVFILGQRHAFSAHNAKDAIAFDSFEQLLDLVNSQDLSLKIDDFELALEYVNFCGDLCA